MCDSSSPGYMPHGRGMHYVVSAAKVNGRKQWRFLVLGRQLFSGECRRTVAYGRFHRGRVVIESGLMSVRLIRSVTKHYRRLKDA